MASPWSTTIAPIGLIPPPPDGRFDEDYNQGKVQKKKKKKKTNKN